MGDGNEERGVLVPWASYGIYGKGQSSGIPGLTDIRMSGDSPLIRYRYHRKRLTRAFRQVWME